MSATYYEVLGVERDASPEEIKQAWRESSLRLDPSVNAAQFRLFNEAAEVLLDPRRRAEYDASLSPVEEPAAQPEPDEPEEADPVDAPVAAAPPARRTPPFVSTRVLLALAVVTALAVALAGYAFVRAQEAADLDRARRAAPAAAERAAAAILGYDYRQLDADKEAALDWLAPSYRKEYSTQLDALAEKAVADKVIVTAEVYASAVMPSDTDGGTRIDVLLYLDQTRILDGRPSAPVANRVRFSMVRSGERWLVRDITSYDT